MKHSKHFSLLGFCLFMAACVTVNVYFPAAAAEKVVDEFVKEVYGEESALPEDQSESEGSVEDNTSSEWKPLESLETGLSGLIEIFIPVAMAAQPNIDIATPATNKLKSSMTARHQQLAPFYASGAVGMTGNALLVVRDAKAISLKQRNTVKQLVAEENRDRNQLYKEIAVANKHPEWEGDIRNLFARQWIANAPGGWWYDNGGWQQK
ncbi:MAG: YdbL family protein [Gammaproteobacteria bacterium]